VWDVSVDCEDAAAAAGAAIHGWLLGEWWGVGICERRKKVKGKWKEGRKGKVDDRASLD